ncbi:MAG: T9SS type A sorting domain-containing protein [Ignavibacteria bacterium]|nr:T9SS type A sorting domain-containing protein [Ignavibacteria bacterium]
MKTTISLFLVLIFTSSVFAQWTLTNGVGTTNGNTLYTVGNDIYAGTDSKAYRTTNNGDSWIEINDGFGSSRKIRDFSYSNLTSTIWCAAENSGLYFSTNNGANWIREFGSITTTPIAVVTVNQYVIMARSGSISSTTNNGLNWIAMDGNNPSYSSQRSLGTDGSKIYLGNGSDGVYVTFLGGTSWTRINGNLTGNSLTINELRCANSKIYIATGAGIYSSTNNGTNWINLNPSLSTTSIWSLSVLNSNIIIGTANKIYLSTNDGANWSDITAGLPANPNVSEIDYNNQYIFAILQTGAVYRLLKSSVIGISNISTEIPNKFTLSQNYPNPFNPTTNIEFSIPEKSFVKLNVFDISGRQVSQLANENLSAGTFRYDFNAENLPSGTYFYKLETDKFSETKKMILMK